MDWQTYAERAVESRSRQCQHVVAERHVAVARLADFETFRQSNFNTAANKVERKIVLVDVNVEVDVGIGKLNIVDMLNIAEIINVGVDID